MKTTATELLRAALVGRAVRLGAMTDYGMIEDIWPDANGTHYHVFVHIEAGKPRQDFAVPYEKEIELQDQAGG